MKGGRGRKEGERPRNASSWIRPCSASSIQHPFRQFLRTSLPTLAAINLLRFWQYDAIIKSLLRRLLRKNVVQRIEN